MSSSNGRTKRSTERDKGRTRNTGAQTSRQEALAVELVRRAFASPQGSMWDDVPGRDKNPERFKEANFDRGVLQRQGVVGGWPHPIDGWVQDEWGDRESRRIRQFHDSHPEAKRLAEAGSRPPMFSSAPMGGRDYEPLDSSYQPHYAQRPNYAQYHKEGERDMETQDGFYAALGRIFGR